MATNSALSNQSPNGNLMETVIEGIPFDDPRYTTPTKLETSVDGKNKRNTFACVGCHSLKQKCVPSDFNDIYRKPCARCLKQRKKCKFDLSKRTRKRKGRISRPNSELNEKTSPIDNISPTPSNSIAISPVIQSPSVLSHKRSYLDMTNALNATNIDSAMKGDMDRENDSRENNSLNNMDSNGNMSINYYPNTMPVPPSLIPIDTNNMNMWQPISQENINANLNMQNRNIPMSNFVNMQESMLTEQDVLNNNNVSNNNNNNNNNNKLISPVSSNINTGTPSLVNTQLNNGVNGRQDSGGLELLQNAILTNGNLTPNGLSKNEKDSPITDINTSTSNNNDTISNANKRMKTNNDNNDNDNDKRNNKKNELMTTNSMTTTTHYHMKHEFKKSLQSLLIVLKGKVSDVSNKFNLWSTQWNKLVESSMFLPTISDPVSIGIISMDEAKLRLKLYTDVIAFQSRLPFVHIPKGASINDIRREKPIFFSAVMSIVSTVMTEDQTSRDTVMRLDSFVINLITMQIFKLNNKSIEVIEALVTLCMWYNFLEWSNKTRYHLFNYICCCLTKDLGPTSVNRSFGMFNEEDPYKYKARVETPLEQAENGDVLTMLVYISALNISIYLRQAVQARWNSLTEGAVKSISRRIKELKAINPDQIDSGETMTNINIQIEENTMLITFARLNHLLEKIHIHLHEMKDLRDDEVPSDHQLTEEYIQLLIDRYQRQLDEVFKEIPRSRPRLLAFYYSVEAYLHQFTLSEYFRRESIDKVTTTSLPANVTRAFLRCYDCCTNSLNEFLKLSSTLIASLPLFHMSRIIYIVGMLILKLRYSVVSIPAFHHLIDITDGTIDLVKQVSNRLDNASKAYPFNNGLYKFQYVIALFGQTYATKVTELAERMEKNQQQGNMNSVTQFNSQLLYPVTKNSRSSPKLKTLRKKQEYNNMDQIALSNNNITAKNNNSTVNNNGNRFVNSTDNTSNSGFYVKEENTEGLIPGVKGDPVNGSSVNDFNFQTNPLGGSNSMSSQSLVNSMHSSGIRASSPSIASDNLNEYLSDINSLALGYNALNDEFWTDLLFNNM